MDTFAHAAWAFVFFRNQRWRNYAIAFAVLPDLLFLPHFFSGKLLANIPYSDALQALYPYSHSLVTLLFASVAFFLLYKPAAYAMLAGWGSHILLDLPSHLQPTLYLLYPISDMRWGGLFNWYDIPALFINYALISVAMLYIFYESKRKREGPHGV